jgi:hypothetical protein
MFDRRFRSRGRGVRRFVASDWSSPRVGVVTTHFLKTVEDHKAHAEFANQVRGLFDDETRALAKQAGLDEIGALKHSLQLVQLFKFFAKSTPEVGVTARSVQNCTLSLVRRPWRGHYTKVL